jgi:hypothetical protein
MIGTGPAIGPGHGRRPHPALRATFSRAREKRLAVLANLRFPRHGLDVATNRVHGCVTLEAEASRVRKGPNIPRALVFLFALAFLFESWIWNGAVAMARWIATLFPWAAFKSAFARLIEPVPAWVALLIFGVPFLVSELGSFVCVLLTATGHVIAGVVGYIAFKAIGLSLVAVIFDLTRDKLLTMPWFVVVYGKFLAFHDYAHALVQPYRDAGMAYLNSLRARARAYWTRRLVGAEEKVR